MVALVGGDGAQHRGMLVQGLSTVVVMVDNMVDSEQVVTRSVRVGVLLATKHRGMVASSWRSGLTSVVLSSRLHPLC